MASRKAPHKAPTAANRLVPALRDAVDVVERALAELGRTPGTAKKRAAARKPAKPTKPRKP
jgi:hypothetical protein